ncbi:sll1515 [Synechocystis sp. PCC 6803]|jgi:hypothetical protein|uniref:Sll1515 protein n=1 Tax=Synechocystis sp. (strain ATCC 27184 / PCC 6803 / Kazusa) TaxID=1111708 RepID=P72975_SYNY3|nr:MULTISPECIES: DUF4278 domain-containing protein [unclassified Synechocystis]BAM50707.1 hypothetical protein BEST7613_1776 [Synechocystis sp. PCC 6803] [Bacillus subtilis BEST7613]AGF50683.1 hypothetical protein MYO_14230 [Synechocystis sp. PCC 6803]ALJ66751.1 hypothetical protein AOY38_02155 [Synechocystis sp. PCC 6803]AVP88594.1 DUF4278 domain-containing protein [Synechocystis sp. IPPAS B-1465]MBD2618261.1 DUF4278 domain-containing protein [Synechocystis sp. FACHB-898]
MQLSYRGVKYDYNPPKVETEVLGLAGSYRGLDYRFRRTTTKNVIQPNVNLTYRGVSFNPAQDLQPELYTANKKVEVAAAPSQISFQDRVRARLHSKTQAIKKRQQSLLVRLAEEIGLSGDQAVNSAVRIQGKVLANFRSDYASQGVAMS